MSKKCWCLDIPSEKFSPEHLVKEKIPKNCLVSNLAWPKKVGPDPPLKNKCPQCLVMEKIPKKFLISNLMWPKKLVPWPHCEKFRVHSALYMKKFWKIFDLKFGMTKKSWCPDPLPKIQCPQCFVNKKILKNFWPQIYCEQKNWCPDPPPLTN